MSDLDKLESANLPVVSKQIGDHRYTVTRLGWWAMLDALHQLEALVGPSLSTILEADSTSVQDLLDVSGGHVAGALTGLLRRVTAKEGQALLRLLSDQTVVDVGGGRQVSLSSAVADTWFSQHPEDAIPWLLFCLEVQFRSFFEQPMRDLGSKLKGLAEKNKTTGL